MVFDGQIEAYVCDGTLATHTLRTRCQSPTDLLLLEMICVSNLLLCLLRRSFSTGQKAFHSLHCAISRTRYALFLFFFCFCSEHVCLSEGNAMEKFV